MCRGFLSFFSGFSEWFSLVFCWCSCRGFLSAFLFRFFVFLVFRGFLAFSLVSYTSPFFLVFVWVCRDFLSVFIGFSTAVFFVFFFLFVVGVSLFFSLVLVYGFVLGISLVFWYLCSDFLSVS